METLLITLAYLVLIPLAAAVGLIVMVLGCFWILKHLVKVKGE